MLSDLTTLFTFAQRSVPCKSYVFFALYSLRDVNHFKMITDSRDDRQNKARVSWTGITRPAR